MRRVSTWPTGVYPGANAANDFNVIRNYKYTITLTIKGANPGDRVVVNKTTDDLSANGTSNCYIVSKADANTSSGWT